MTEGAPIQGVFAAIPTPFDERRGVDVKALEYLADTQSDTVFQSVNWISGGAVPPKSERGSGGTRIRGGWRTDGLLTLLKEAVPRREPHSANGDGRA